MIQLTREEANDPSLKVYKCCTQCSTFKDPMDYPVRNYGTLGVGFVCSQCVQDNRLLKTVEKKATMKLRRVAEVKRRRKRKANARLQDKLAGIK